jgi:hypothetical protein
MLTTFILLYLNVPCCDVGDVACRLILYFVIIIKKLPEVLLVLSSAKVKYYNTTEGRGKMQKERCALCNVIFHSAF